jgi:membrane associated rhomboid family serine protease
MNSSHEVESSNERKVSINDFKMKLSKIFFNIPFFIKCYFIITIILYILTLKIKIIAFYLVNIPKYTIFYFQLWRLLTSVFITTSILQIILAFFVWIKYATILETSLGTIKYTLIFFLNAICIQIINIILIFFVSLLNKNLFTPEMKTNNNSGLWGIVMCEMTLLCFSNPESPMKLLLLPFTVKAKIYPAILVILFFLVNFDIDIEIISGIIYGLIYFYYLKSKLQISDSFVQKLEEYSFFKNLLNIKGFISVSHISTGLPVSITKITNIDNEQEKEKLKGKRVIIAGALAKNMGEVHQNDEAIPTNTNENMN